MDLLAGVRRFGALLAALAGIVAALSVAAGLAVGASVGHALATGFYLVGSFLLLVGVFSGIRGPLRPRGGEEGRDTTAGLFGIGIFSRGARTATADERSDARSTTWLFLALGLSLILLGVGVDGRAALVP